MNHCRDEGKSRQYHQFTNAETGEVWWVAVSDVKTDKPKDVRGKLIKSLILSEIEMQEVPKKALLGAQKSTFAATWGRLDMDGCRSLYIKGLTGMQYDVLMVLVESSRYGNKVEIERDVIAAKTKATPARISNALKVLEQNDIITRLGMGYLMFNPDIILVGEVRFRCHWRGEYRTVRESRMAKKQCKKKAKNPAQAGIRLAVDNERQAA